jgi:hypothetical protein
MSKIMKKHSGSIISKLNEIMAKTSAFKTQSNFLIT